jgi:hypothetical protein
MERQKKKTPFSGKQTPMNWRCIWQSIDGWTLWIVHRILNRTKRR